MLANAGETYSASHSGDASRVSNGDRDGDVDVDADADCVGEGDDPRLPRELPGADGGGVASRGEGSDAVSAESKTAGVDAAIGVIGVSSVETSDVVFEFLRDAVVVVLVVVVAEAVLSRFALAAGFVTSFHRCTSGFDGSAVFCEPPSDFIVLLGVFFCVFCAFGVFAGFCPDCPFGVSVSALSAAGVGATEKVEKPEGAGVVPLDFDADLGFALRLPLVPTLAPEGCDGPDVLTNERPWYLCLVTCRPRRVDTSAPSFWTVTLKWSIVLYMFSSA